MIINISKHVCICEISAENEVFVYLAHKYCGNLV